MTKIAVRFTKGETIGSLIIGLVLAIYVCPFPWRIWIEPVLYLLGGIIVASVMVGATKLIRKRDD
jgi:hypothetical protein